MKTLIALFVLVSASLAQNSFWEDAILFSAGYATGHVAHEFGHELSAQVVGIDHDWKTSPNFPFVVFVDDNTAPRHKQAFTALGGFGAEVISAQILLSGNAISDGRDVNPFFVAWTIQTIVSPIAYCVIDALTPCGWGDLRAYELMGYRKGPVRAFLLGHSLVSMIRLFGVLPENSSWNIHSDATHLTITVNL